MAYIFLPYFEWVFAAFVLKAFSFCVCFPQEKVCGKGGNGFRIWVDVIHAPPPAKRTRPLLFRRQYNPLVLLAFDNLQCVIKVLLAILNRGRVLLVPS